MLRCGARHFGVIKQSNIVTACDWEGIVAKRKASTYQPGVPDWLKVKRKGAVPPERFKR